MTGGILHIDNLNSLCYPLQGFEPCRRQQVPIGVRGTRKIRVRRLPRNELVLFIHSCLFSDGSLFFDITLSARLLKKEEK